MKIEGNPTRRRRLGRIGRIGRTAALSAIAALVLAAVSPPSSSTAAGGAKISKREAKNIAGRAYIYGFPIVVSYGSMVENSVDKSSPQYKAPFNQLVNETRIVTPADTGLVTPSLDTLGSVVWMDLRAEPVVLCVPEVEKGRYYAFGLYDLYTYLYGYVGTRATGNGAGCYLIAGPGWKGATPAGIKKIFRSETWLSAAIGRTQIVDAGDLDNVKKIQSGYRAETLSTFLRQPPPPAAPAIDFPKFDPTQALETAIFGYLSFALQFCPAPPEEEALRSQFAKIGIEAGKPFAFEKLSVEDAETAIEEAYEKIETAAEQTGVNVDGWMFGPGTGNRAFYKGNWLARAANARTAPFGSSLEELIAPAAFGIPKDELEEKLDASKGGYTLTFSKDQVPPVEAFWSLTLYDGKTRRPVANPLERYLVNSKTFPRLKKDAKGDVTIRIQKDSPGAADEANWLPAPDGQFYLVMRLYWPKPSVLKGGWKPPPVKQAS